MIFWMMEKRFLPRLSSFSHQLEVEGRVVGSAGMAVGRLGHPRSEPVSRQAQRGQGAVRLRKKADLGLSWKGPYRTFIYQKG